MSDLSIPHPTQNFTLSNGDTSLAAGKLAAELQALVDVAKVKPLQPEPELVKPDLETTKFLLAAGLSDEGDAQCLIRLYPDCFLHSEALGWLAYTGTHWQSEGAEARLDRAIVETLLARIRATWQTLGEDGSGEEDDSFGRHLRAFCTPNKGRVEGAKHLLRSIVHAEPADFDAHPDLLNCLNGVLDLRTGELSPHAPTQRFMHCTKVAYKPGANSGAWVDWLTNATSKVDDPASGKVIDFLQLAIGYTLTGHTREEVLFYPFGPPRAGKGILMETMLALLGSPLAKEVNFSTFTAQRTGDSQNFDLAPLKPCRLVAASESNTYERFNEAKIKAITGGNEVYCAHKHRTHFNYRPQFKLWLSSNQPVNADPDDDAVWARIRLIEFPHSHLGSEDKTLKQRMRAPAVLEGVLAWAVQGAIKWYALGGAGLPELPGSEKAKQLQRDSLDAVGMWIDECCSQGPGVFCASSLLYLSYETWCKSNGTEPRKMKGLTTALQRKGYRADRQSSGGKQVRGFVGLKIS